MSEQHQRQLDGGATAEAIAYHVEPIVEAGMPEVHVENLYTDHGGEA
jgi:hypothetical protein